MTMKIHATDRVQSREHPDRVGTVQEVVRGLLRVKWDIGSPCHRPGYTSIKTTDEVVLLDARHQPNAR